MSFCYSREEDVTRTMYTAAYNRDRDAPVAPVESDRPSKVDTVCDAMNKALQQIDRDK